MEFTNEHQVFLKGRSRIKWDDQATEARNCAFTTIHG